LVSSINDIEEELESFIKLDSAQFFAKLEYHFEIHQRKAVQSADFVEVLGVRLLLLKCLRSEIVELIIWKSKWQVHHLLLLSWLKSSLLLSPIIVNIVLRRRISDLRSINWLNALLPVWLLDWRLRIIVLSWMRLLSINTRLARI